MCTSWHGHRLCSVHAEKIPRTAERFVRHVVACAGGGHAGGCGLPQGRVATATSTGPARLHAGKGRPGDLARSLSNRSPREHRRSLARRCRWPATYRRGRERADIDYPRWEGQADLEGVTFTTGGLDG